MASESTGVSWGAAVAAFVERYILSSIYFVMVGLQIHAMVTNPVLSNNRSAILARAPLLILNTFIACVLLLSRRPSVPPRRARDILVPLAASFYYLLYDPNIYSGWVANELSDNLCPLPEREYLLYVALGLSILGPLIAFSGVWYLRRSFGVFVTVRQVVLRGPYRYVRHPMYLGYICMLIGILLANFSIWVFVLVPLHIWLFAYRAGLEEERLAEASPEYREMMKRTGFLFPKFW